MSDLLHKQFEFGGVVFGYGAILDVEEFERQGGEANTQDLQRHHEDSIAFGFDTVNPETWRWTLFTRHDNFALASSDLKTLERAWRDPSIRRTPGKVVPIRYALRTLTPNGIETRTKVVFGRPRRFEIDYGGGLSDIGLMRVDMDFQLVDMLSYGDGVEATSILAPPAVPSGFLVPFEAPLFTTEPPEPIQTFVQSTDADTDSPFEAEFVGPITNPRLSGNGWSLELDAHIPAGQSITVYTYPWSLRAVRSDGANVSGYLKSDTRLSKIRLSPNGETLHYDGQDATSTSVCYIRWRPAHSTI